MFCSSFLVVTITETAGSTSLTTEEFNTLSMNKNPAAQKHGKYEKLNYNQKSLHHKHSYLELN